MQTIFQTGLPRNNLFWLGQQQIAPGTTANLDTLNAQLNDAMNKYGIIVNFANQSNYRQILGTDADRFDLMKASVDAIYSGTGSGQPSVPDIQGYYGSGQESNIRPEELQILNDFITGTNALYQIVLAHTGGSAVKPPPAGPLPAQPIQTVSPGGILSPSTPPRPPGAVVPGAAAIPSAGPSPLLVGGLAAAGIAVVALALAR